MKKILFTALLAGAFAFAYAKPYPKHDLSKIVTPNSVNFAVAEQIYQDLSRHAQMYPTTFDNARDKALATAESKELSRIFNSLLHTKIITPQHEAYLQILHRAARINWMAHNLDVPQAAAYADRHYQTLLSAVSGKEKAAVLGEYGNFLASVGQTDKAVALLKQSVQAGNAAAKKTLAMALLAQGKQNDAERNLREYVKAHPQDTDAKKILQAVQAGRVEVKSIK